MSKYGLMDPGTCLPVLEAICHVVTIDTAIEFGCGLWSTQSLTRNCKRVISVEDVKEWVDTVKKEYSHRGNLEVVHWDKGMDTYMKDDDTFDLIFIDGNERVETLNNAFYKSSIIVCHDTHTKGINWGDANVPDDYLQLTYTGCEPYLTTIFYHRDMDLKNVLFDRDNYQHKGTYIDANFWTDIDLMARYK